MVEHRQGACQEATLQEEQPQQTATCVRDGEAWTLLVCAVQQVLHMMMLVLLVAIVTVSAIINLVAL